MPIHIKETPHVEVSQSELNRLRGEYDQAFMMYCGTPPDFEEWAIRRIQERQKRENAD